MKKLLIIIFAIFLCGCSEKTNPSETPSEPPNAGSYGEALPITRGEVSRMLALCLYDYSEITGLEYKAEFSDVTHDDALYKYINAVASAGVMSGANGEFRPDDYLTVQEASYLINAIDKSGRLNIETDERTMTSPISYCKWTEIIDKLSQADSPMEIQTSSMTVLLTQYTNSEAENFIITDKGLYLTDGFIDRNLENCQCEFTVKGDCIINVRAISSVTPTLEKCLVVRSEKNKTDIYVCGVKKELNGEISSDKDCPYIADIQINGKAIENSTPYTQEKSGKIIMADDVLLFDDDFSYNISPDFTVYRTYDGISSGNVRKLISGSSARVFFKDNKAVCAICYDVPKDKIRVVITNTNGSPLNSSLTLYSDKGLTVKSGESSSVYTEPLTINKTTAGGLFRGKISINGKAYGSHVDVITTNDGCCAVCELDMNEYLYGVVCGEMPASYGSEALMAQALAARSYAYNQLFSNKRLEYGGNIDDTVAFQVYDPDTICPEAVDAVDKTEGEYIVYGDDVINANFYSTSCGLGANSGEIWPDGDVYPAKTPEYLSSHTIGDFEKPDFSDEEKALNFFRLKPDKAYEKDFPYYRWSFAMPYDGFKSDSGKITSATITQRGDGGNVMSMTLEGENGDIKLVGENAVRNCIKPVNIKLSDGSVREMSSLPSTFFAIEENDGMLYFYGGGFGHGVGMSQNGAKAISDMGMDHKKIISAFFTGCEIKKIE